MLAAVDFTDPRNRAIAAELAREDFYFFSRYMFLRRRGYAWKRGPHHQQICDALMRVYRGECLRLIMNMPPRYTKTTLAIEMFIAWAMGHAPDSEFIHTSYGAMLAAGNAGQCRDLILSPAYREVFPEVRLGKTGEAHFTTSRGGVVYAAGSGGSITGFGAGKERDEFGGAIMIDDPHKPDEARSDVVRESVIDWFQSTLESRKNSPSRTPIVLVMQRLHERDLAGWLLGGGNGEQWEHLCLSAWADEAAGVPLWPEKHSAEDLRRMERAAPYHFAGQYRQSPTTPAGNIFTPGQMPIVDAIPAGAIQWARGWDFGGTTTGDYTVGFKLGRLEDGRFIIADVVRVQELPHDRDATFRNTAAADTTACRISIPQDPGQAGKTQVSALSLQLPGYPLHSSPETGDKIVRAEPFAAQVNVGNVLMLRGAWNKELVDEMRLFPNGKFDDQIDASSRAFARLLSVGDGAVAAAGATALAQPVHVTLPGNAFRPFSIGRP